MQGDATLNKCRLMPTQEEMHMELALALHDPKLLSQRRGHNLNDIVARQVGIVLRSANSAMQLKTSLRNDTCRWQES